jgi:light-regulated signal transduction histidine kinase (bacteriophytochrome)
VCGDRLTGTGKEMIAAIRASTEHMTNLIHALLKLATLGRSEVHCRQTDLSSLAHTIATELQQVHPDRNVEFIIADGVSAAGDPVLLRIVMDNLIGNAWKFTSLVDFARIEFGVTYPAGEPAEYFVRDNGGGFDMQYAGKLFGAFQRLHLDDEFPGTGIGLATVQRIVHRHGGRIRAESSLGQGATFYFDFDGVQIVPSSYQPSSPAFETKSSANFLPDLPTAM